jgi:histone-lysine N-methyltransferase SUV39H
VFKTVDKGWGVRTLNQLPRGTFVSIYFGELITTEEAEERGKAYDAEGRSYLFDLDFDGDSNCHYTIDAYHYGNVSRFFNHSCDPNMQVIPVHYDHPDESKYHIAFFTLQTVKKGEELTFDYHGLHRENDTTSIPDDQKRDCKCNSENCRQRVKI